MYQPKIRDDQVRQLYLLPKSTRKPMTEFIRKAAHDFLANKRGVKDHEDRTGVCEAGVERSAVLTV